MVVGMVGLGSQPAAHNRISQVTWTTDVEPIMKARCLGLSHTGGFGPMSLETFQQARTWARATREEVLDRRMPPRPAARGFGFPGSLERRLQEPEAKERVKKCGVLPLSTQSTPRILSVFFSAVSVVSAVNGFTGV